jgi:hypothetical protein
MGAIHWSSRFYRPRPRIPVKFAALPWNEDEFISTWCDFTEFAKPDGISLRVAEGAVAVIHQTLQPGREWKLGLPAMFGHCARSLN